MRVNPTRYIRLSTTSQKSRLRNIFPDAPLSCMTHSFSRKYLAPNVIGSPTMENSWKCLTPFDGRYSRDTQGLARICGEGGLISRRVKVQCLWLALVLHDLQSLHVLSPSLFVALRRCLTTLETGLTDSQLQRIKDFEATTRHDVKACENFIREEIKQKVLSDEVCHANRILEMVHWGSTSEDVNNLAIALQLNDAKREEIEPRLAAAMRFLLAGAKSWANSPMLSLTHGQPATPTTFGKELSVFCVRLGNIVNKIRLWKPTGKFNGATGNYAAHRVAAPSLDWQEISRAFVEETVGIEFQPVSTQIECHDRLGDLLVLLSRFCSVGVGLCQDLWLYTSRGLLVLKTVETEIGSSVMPHKVNPIDFENAEGNFKLGRSFLWELSSTLSVSRMQRDLSDSTVLRNVGIGLAYVVVGCESLIRGLSRVDFCQAAADKELEAHWEVLTEAVQTVLRLEGVANAYETLKRLVRKSAPTTAPEYHKIVESFRSQISPEAMERLEQLTPASYVGFAKEISLDVVDRLSDQFVSFFSDASF